MDVAPLPEDRAYRRAAEAYFQEKLAEAETHFDARLLEVFHGFADHWKDYFAPAEAARLREYLAMAPAVRRAQFERFRRECRAWELNFKLMRSAKAGNGQAPSRERPPEWRRRLERQNDREAEVERLYKSLDGLFDKQRQNRRLPPELHPHLRLLGVASDASVDEIKKQYRRLAKLHHPDRQGDAALMQRLNHAFHHVMAFYKRTPVRG